MNPTVRDLTFTPATDADLIEVLSWFESAKSLFYWGGPDLTYPPELARFKTESKYAKNHSYVLKRAQEVVAFGQFYNRLDHCHLGRLAVAPDQRGLGLGAELIKRLNQQGRQVLNLTSGSLFVLDDNLPAMHLYQKLGYKVATYPKKIPIENCLYLTKNTL